jgi:hypothetical protein
VLITLRLVEHYESQHALPELAERAASDVSLCAPTLGAKPVVQIASALSDRQASELAAEAKRWARRRASKPRRKTK